ncbi:MAG TPA: hypothetical protein VFB73_14050 [Chloroflexota bacterium]|nr:hypothetical protein [Chloroflexota bacterium]HZU07084.1 hypothetical protein [Chloroflexota bacterium]
MRRRSISRRRLLAGAGAGGAALALRAAFGDGARASPLVQPPEGISPQLLGQLAQYANSPLPPDRAAQLMPLLAEPLAALRRLRPPGYDDLAPTVSFRVPVEG